MAGTGASTKKIFLSSTLTPPAPIPKTIPPPAGAPGSSAYFNLGDDQKRWLVTGVCLNKVLLPALRDFLDPEMIKHYTYLRTTQNINKQNHKKHLLKDGKCSLNYGSVNNNEATHRKKAHLYDYDVKSEVDLAKLYLQPFMTKFTGFDDTCDLSAVLGILSSASVFSSAVQGLSSDVRKDVRNEWGHCNFGHWNGTKFAKCFQQMESLVRALALSPASEKRITDELQDWETKGLQLCLGNIVDADLVKFIETEVDQLTESVKHLEKSQADEALRVSNALQSVQKAFEEYKQEINMALESMKESQDNLSKRVDHVADNTSTIAKTVDSLKEDQKSLTVKVDTIETNQDTLTKRVDVGEENHACLEKRVEALETAIEAKSTQEAIITFQAPKRIPCFHGRAEELEVLNQPLEKKTAPCSMTAVYGLGGTGKTSLAIEHIWRNKEVYSGGVFWISGESNSLFDLSMREMARQIGTFDEDFQTTLSKTISWLQQRKQYWCLVIDNLDELELSREMLKLIGGHWKRQAKGHIIITTRREKHLLEEEISDFSEESCMELKNLTEAESIEFIKMRTGRRGTQDDAVIRELVVELGTLPLALDQAAAFIKNKKEISFSRYLDQYKKQKLQILKRSKAHYPAQDTSKDRIAVHTTWQLNFEYVSRLSEEYGIGQAAALVMEVSAFLSPDDIPQEIINQGLPPLHNEDFINCLSTSFGVTDIVGVLTKFSLFQVFTDNSFSVHRLVQEVIRSRISHEHLKNVLLCACRMLYYAFASAKSPTEVCKSFEGDSVFSQDNLPSLHLWGKLGAHASVLQKYVIQNSQQNDAFRQEVLYTEEAAMLLNEASLYFSVCHQKVEAMELQALKLNILTQLDELSSQRLDYFKYFDIPLKSVEFKLISHCMAIQEKSVSTDEDGEEFSEHTEEHLQKANQLREEGNNAVRQQHFGEAINLYTEAIEYNKDDARLYNNRAHCKLMLGKPEEALLDCDLCLKLEERNGKALMRKAWALYELSKTQGEQLKGRMRAAAALAAYIDPTAKNGKRFNEMFPDLIFEEILNPLQLAGLLMLSFSGITLLLHEGYYELHGSMIDKELQLVALSKGVVVNFQALPIMQCSFYAEGITFAKDSGGIKCHTKGSLSLLNCQVSGGFRCCKDFPDCNGGPGCVASTIAGRKPCDRTGKFGDHGEISGIGGYPSICVTGGSTGHIENCEITDSGGGGILCQGDGSSLTVKSCRVNRNGQAGLEAREGGRLVAIDNDIYANRYHGILIGPSAGECKVTSNRIYENCAEGIFVLRTDDNVMVNSNRIYHNLAFGISLERCQIEIEGNEIFENNFYGILAKSLTTAIVENNDIYSNKCGGICIGVNYSGRVVIKSNVVRDHSGPWLQYERGSFSLPDSMASSNPAVTGFFSIPKGETKVFTLPPTLIDNALRNNEEKASHPKKKIESIQSECAFCHNTKNLQRCPKCSIALYCNSTCRERHWEKHRALCSALKDQFFVTVEPRKFCSSGFSSSSLRTFGSHLKGIGKGPKPDPKSKRRFIVKIQTAHLNGHPLQNLVVYDRSLYIDGFIQSPEIFHVIMECGVLGQFNKFTSKKAYFYSTFAEGGKKLKIYLGELAPYQEWLEAMSRVAELQCRISYGIQTMHWATLPLIKVVVYSALETHLGCFTGSSKALRKLI